MRLLNRLALPIMWLHQGLYVRTRGWIGHRWMGVPTLVLHTVGRRTGAARTSALVYARDGDAFLVVGSNGGLPAAPGWVHNVRTRPEVELQVGRRRLAAVATVVEATDADHARLFALADARNRGRYTRYQARTERPIPVVRLLPAPTPLAAT